MPKVSVVMPAFNAEKYIGQAIESIIHQTFTDFELIIIDDCSTDRTADVIRRYEDDRIRYVKNEQNMGIARTLNRGLDLANGTYIARMDSDDISLTERFQKQVAFMDANADVAVLGTGIQLFGAQSGERLFSVTNEQLKVDTLFSSCFAHPSVMLRACWFGENGLQYDNAYNKMEDYDLWVRTAKTHQLAALPEVLLKYRIHPNQVTQKPTRENKIQLRMLKERQISALGMDASGTGFETFLSYCLGELKPASENITVLASFFREILAKNQLAGIYEGRILQGAFHTVLKGLLAGIPWGEAAIIAGRCGFSPVLYSAERWSKGFLAKSRAKIHQKKLQSKLRQKEFTIISNNCWGSFIYQKYGLKYMTPTAGLYILGHDFVKLCANWQWYMTQELVFIKWEDASYYYALKDVSPYPVAKLGDIEIYFMHYHSEQEAAEKWYRRAKRIDSKHMLFKLSQREECSRADVEAFMALPLEHKICFAYDDVPGIVHVPELQDFVGDEFPLLQQYYDELSVLNEL